MHLFKIIIQKIIDKLVLIYNLDFNEPIIHVDYWRNFHINVIHNENKTVMYLFAQLITNNELFHYKNKFKFLSSVLQNPFMSEKDKTGFFEIFQKIQKKYFIITRFFRNYKLRHSEIQINHDVFLNPIQETDKNVMLLFQNNKRYLFTITDLVNLLNTSLGNTYYFFAEPKACKNPYNNMPFNKADLYNIYFFMKSRPIIMPTLFHAFFLANFNLTTFKNDNEDNIREYAIRQYLEVTPNNKLRLICITMLSNNRHTQRMRIHKNFPTDILVNVLKPYLNLYLHTKYSTETNKKHEADMMLDTKLKEFVKFNKNFGRKRMILDVNDFSCSLKKKYIVSYNCMCKSYHHNEEDNFMNSHLNVVKYYDDDEFSETDDDDYDDISDEESEVERIPGREVIEREVEDENTDTDTDIDIEENENIVENTTEVFTPSYNIIGVHHVESNEVLGGSS
jgi:hypothetical protein